MAGSNGQNGTGDTSPHHQAEVKQKTPVAPLVTRSTKTPTTTTRKPERVTRSAGGVLPEDTDEKQSVTLEGFLFKRDGVGWECRETVYIEAEGTGKRQRKRPYLAHLSRTNYEKMKAKCSTDSDLAAKLIEWAKRKKAEKHSR